MSNIFYDRCQSVIMMGQECKQRGWRVEGTGDNLQPPSTSAKHVLGGGGGGRGYWYDPPPPPPPKSHTLSLKVTGAPRVAKAEQMFPFQYKNLLANNKSVQYKNLLANTTMYDSERGEGFAVHYNVRDLSAQTELFTWKYYLGWKAVICLSSTGRFNYEVFVDFLFKCWSIFECKYVCNSSTLLILTYFDLIQTKELKDRLMIILHLKYC